MPAYVHEDGVLATGPEEVATLQAQGYDKCRNQLCTFMVSPETIRELYEHYGDEAMPWQCPHCGLNYDLAKVPGKPGGMTNAGININEMGQIGEDLVKELGGLPGYGKFLWFHPGGYGSNSAFDAAVQGWGVEIKTVNWINQPKARRGIIKPKDRMIKLRAVQNPEIWAKEMNDPKLDEAMHAIGHVQGLLGVLVLLDFETGLADIFMRPMPHDPEHQYGGIIHFGLYQAVPVAEGVPFKSTLPDPRAEGWTPYHEQPSQPEVNPFDSKVGTSLDPTEIFSDVEPWQPGKVGRIVIDPTGNYVAWVSQHEDSDQEVHHYMMVEAAEFGHDSFDGHITPEGTVVLYVEARNDWTPEVEARLAKTLAQGGLKLAPTGGWHFGTKVGTDFAGDSHPAQEPQAAQDIASQYPSDGGNLPGEREYKFFYGNGELHVSAAHTHEQLSQHARVPGDHTGPVAVGYVTVIDNYANWEVNTNMAVHAFSRILKDYTKHVGWQWGGLTDLEGEPLGTGSEYAPKKSKLEAAWFDGHLYLRASHKDRWPFYQQPDLQGKITIQGKTATVGSTMLNDMELFAALQEWAHDQDYRLVERTAHGFVPITADYPGGSNMNDLIKNQQDIGGEDLELHNIYSPKAPRTIEDDRTPSGVFKCPNCHRLYPDWRTYMRHRQKEEPRGDEQAEDGRFPEIDLDKTLPAHYHEREPQVDPIATPNLARVAVKDPKDMIKHPVPFIYDINEDAIFVGEPGAKHSDIQGKFTPGGIVEGTYEPGGKVLFRSMTSTPYSVRHVLDLWTWQHPEFEITGLALRDDAGQETKLASIQVGEYLRTLALADPAVYGAYQALKDAGGRVYVVGGAVRDALLQKEPKDIDLMVQGVPSDAVRTALSALPGRVDLTGKDFGVFRYKHKGYEVEIALPRRERSTGAGHQDFDVQTDYTMPVHEDLLRRDFTANAMAVDLDSGELIDPFGGAKDIEERRLRTVSPKSFEEDPLRTVRALVASSKHGLTPTPDTRAQMAANSKGLLHLPQERIQQELDKLFASKDPASAIRLAHETGVLKYMLPEVEEVWDFDQRNPHHKLPLGEHLLSVLHNAAENTEDPDVRMAALLHDIGKPASAWENPETGSLHYYYDSKTGQGADHELVGADMARERLNALRYPKDRTQRVHSLITHHMYPDFSSVKGARKFLNRVGEHADDLFILRHADRYGKGTDQYQDTKTPVPRQRELVQKVREAGQATTQADLTISGNDLIKAGLKPGPQFGAILAELTNEVVEDPTKNTPQYLLNRALELSH